MTVTDFQSKYEGRLQGRYDRARLLNELSEDFERIVRSRPADRDAAAWIKADIVRRIFDDAHKGI